MCSFLLGQMFWLFQQDHLVERGVIVVIEFHDAAHEGVVDVWLLADSSLIVSFERDHYGLFEHLGGLDDCVKVVVFGVFDALDSFDFFFELAIVDCLDVWVSGASVGGVALLTASHASQVAIGVFLPLVFRNVTVLVLVFGLVFLELAALRVLVCLAAAPPHLAAPLALMQLTAPIKVLLFIVLAIAILARLNTSYHLPLAQQQLCNPRLVLLSLRYQSLAISCQQLNP